MGVEEAMEDSLNQECLVHRLSLGLDSSVSSAGALRDAAHGPEAAQRPVDAKKTRKLLATLKRSVAYSQRTKDFRIRTEC